MKRLTTLLLCAAVLVGLFPTAALADDSQNQDTEGIYTSFNYATNKFSGKIGQTDVSGQPGYVVPAGSNAYFVCDKNTEVGFGSGLIPNGEWNLENEDLKVYQLEPGGYYRDYGELIINPGENETVYRVQFTGQLPIPPSPPEGGGMYTTAITDAASAVAWENVGEKLGGSDNWIWGYVVPESANGVAYFVCENGWRCVQKTQPDDRTSLNVKQVGETNVYEITPGDAYGSCGDFRLESEGSGMGITVVFDGYDPNVLAPAHSVTEDERTAALSENEYGPVSFVLDDVTYYMGITDPATNQPASYGGMAAQQDSVVDYPVRVGFWTLDGSGYHAVDGSTLNYILSQLGADIDIELYAESGGIETYPAELKTGPNDGLAAHSWRFSGQDYTGNWQFRAVWKMNDDTTLTSYVRFSLELYQVVESEPLKSVEAVNEWLESNYEEYGLSCNYWVNLAPGEFNGYISIPNGMVFSIIGSGVDATTLNGGLYVGPGGHGGIHDLTMRGAGSQHKRWPQMWFGGEKAPNYGIYGTNSTASFYNVTFEDYYYAVYNADGFGSFGPGENGPRQTVFRNNGTAICVDARDGVGGLSTPLTGTVFEENGRAIELLSFNSDIPPSFYPIYHCKFINNDVDVYNESGRNFFMPGNYFYHDRQSDGSHNYIETDSKNPGKDKKDNKNLVSAYPMMNEAFTEYIYGEDDVAVPNSGEESYMTPYSELPGMDIMVVETGGAEDVPLLSFAFPNAVAGSNGGTVRAASASDARSFDPSVGYERTDTKITLTIGDIPDGLAPTLTVYCDGWDNAAVSFEGRALASSFADEAVSFTACEGGVYTITRTSAPARPSVPSAPEEPETPAAPAFADVPEDSYYADAVQWAVEAGITDGTGEHSFSPNDGCTRAQVITFLWRAANSPDADGLPEFGDVDDGSYYAEAVAWAVSEGITTGVSDGEFAPELTVTRAQFVVMLYRAAGEPEVEDADGFDDVDPAAYYAKAVAWAAAQGITDGTGERTFSPDETCTRAQIVTFMYRALA